MPHSRQASNFPYCQRKQRGAALMVMLVIMVMGAATFLVSSLSKSGMQIERNSKTANALAQAKDALIAYAVSNATRPGNLPCPDRDAPSTTGYGDAEGSCLSSSGTSVGRLPWKTLGIPELVDADGEPLWYALSDNFRQSASAINSDTQANLSIYDNSGTTLLTPSGSEAVAIVFSPGAPIVGQSRSASQSTLCATTNTTIASNRCASNYLDTGANNRNNAAAGGQFIAANKTDTFNDRLLYITTENIFTTIEKLVSKEIEAGIKPMLNAYYAVWGAFPFAAPFTQPSVSPFTGQAATYDGLLPIGNIVNSVPTLAWDTTIPPRYYINGVNSGTCSYSNGAVSNSRLRCISSNTNIPAGQTITFTGKLNNVGFGFWRPHDISTTNEFRVRNSSGTTVLATSMFNNVIITNTLNADGSATITFSAQGKPGGTTVQRIEFRDIQSSSTASLALWLLQNNWHQLAYYAVSQGYAPGGNHTCTAPCLTVNGQGGGNNKQSVVVMMNKALTGKTHTSNSLADYLELENKTPADFIYENKSRSSTFNDQVIIVAP